MASPRYMSSQMLRDLATVAQASNSALRAAKAIDPSGKTIVRELPNHWQEAAWQDHVQQAWNRLVTSLGGSRDAFNTRVADLPAIAFQALAAQLAGYMSEDGRVTGALTTDPTFVMWAKGQTADRTGVSRGVVALLAALCATGGFVVGKLIRGRA